MEVVIDANFGMALGSSSAETMLEFGFRGAQVEVVAGRRR